MRPIRSAAALLAGLLPSLLTAQPARGGSPPATVDTLALRNLTWRHVGPEGNRVTSVTGVPGDRTTYYAGAASGGLWKTTDGGVTWKSIFDRQPVSSVGSLAVAPSDPNAVWAGTGEPFIRSNISVGWGVYRSTDAGATWTKMGLDNTGRISRIVVHPTNPDIVYVAALGHAYGPQPDRGIFRTTDGGRTWEKVLFVNDSTGASDLVMDPVNPRILYAGMWQLQITTWGRFSGGAGSGIWRSTDGGTTWTRLTGKGLPTTPIGKVGLGISRADPQRIYALIEAGDGLPAVGIPKTTAGRLWRSDDGGTSWTVVSYDQQVAGRTHYYNRMGVTPDNADEAYFLTAAWAKTTDGGRTIIDPPPAQTPGGDHHDIWFDPGNGNRFIVSHDGGLSITENRGRTWLRVQLPIAQMYHVATDNRVPYMLYGNRQDGPSTRGPSNSKLGEFGIPRGMWSSVGGGESGWAQPDPVNPDFVWSSASGYGSVGGIVSRWNAATNLATSVEVWPQATIGHAAEEVKYRFVWTFPLHISPHDRNKVYVGSQHVHVTTDSGRTWRLLSPDLSRNDRSRLGRSGGLTPDNIGVEYSGVVFAIAESPRRAGMIWAGTNDGRLHLTRDNGATWTDLSANLPGAPFWGTISNIEPSRYDENTAYLSIDAHQSNNRDPFIYRTTDGGRTWKLLVNGIPRSPLSYVHVVREDPVRRGLLYAGTENGVYVSFTDGESWQPLQNNLPAAPVYWITVQEHFSDLVIATYGRGFWILDDITPLRTLGADVTAKASHLFAPRAAYRFLTAEAPFASYDDPVNGTNPPYGASLHFWSRTAPGDSAVLTVTDASGGAVRTMKVAATAGMNRTWWDLRTDATTQATVRAPNPYHPETRWPAEGRNAPQVQGFRALVPPGTYTVALSIGGQVHRQTVEVRKDPASSGTIADIATQTAMTTQLRRDINSTVEMINATEAARAQLATLTTLLATDTTATAQGLRRQADTLAAHIVGVQEQLMQVRVTGRGQDILRYPFRLAEQLVYLAQVVSASDEAPTNSAREVHTVLQETLRKARASYDAVMGPELEALKQAIRGKVPGVIF